MTATTQAVTTEQPDAPSITLRGSWYLDGSEYLVVLTGQPEHDVRIGAGSTPHEAWESLEDIPIPSTGPDAGEDTALGWAQNAGWIEDVDDLEPADKEAGAAVTEPLGEVNWEAGESYAYVACLYGGGSEPGDCRIRVGEDEAGVWWLDDGDDDHSETVGPCDDRDDAEEAAEKSATEQHEGEEGEDAEGMAARLLDEAAGDEDPEGEYGVRYSESDEPEERHSTVDAAVAASTRAARALKAANPGTRLLSYYEVVELADGEWAPVDLD